MSESTSKRMELGVELLLDDFGNSFALGFDDWICREVNSRP